MKMRLRWLASAATFGACLTLASSASLQNDTLARIANYKQWTQVTQQLPADLVPLDAASIGG